MSSERGSGERSSVTGLHKRYENRFPHPWLKRIVQRAVESAGYWVWDLEIRAKRSGGLSIRVVVECSDTGRHFSAVKPSSADQLREIFRSAPHVSVDECAALSEWIRRGIDNEGSGLVFELEVSSAGIEREPRTLSQWLDYRGYVSTLLYGEQGHPRKRLTGFLIDVCGAREKGCGTDKNPALDRHPAFARIPNDVLQWRFGNEAWPGIQNWFVVLLDVEWMMSSRHTRDDIWIYRDRAEEACRQWDHSALNQMEEERRMAEMEALFRNIQRRMQETGKRKPADRKKMDLHVVPLPFLSHIKICYWNL